jgi:hypothetical protein
MNKYAKNNPSINTRIMKRIKQPSEFLCLGFRGGNSWRPQETQYVPVL